MVKAGVVDYTVGNVGSLVAALRRAGAEVVIISSPEEAEEVDGLVLPGVGAYDSAADLAARFKDVVASKPTLAICLGMQLLFESSEEGSRPGLGVFKGRAERVVARKVPHIGWSYTQVVRDLPFLRSGYFYYLHSYGVPWVPSADYHVAYVELKRRYVAAVYKDGVLGVQFHPERSGRAGLELIKGFLATWRR
ncbi:MAG: imidazole glycerol phosphate synthase subunit HisH [Pyrobaculum sp.]